MIIPQFIATITPALQSDDLVVFQHMAAYLGRSNLWPARHEFSGDEGHVFNFVNEAERYQFSLADLHHHWTGLKAGKALDWSACKRLR